MAPERLKLLNQSLIDAIDAVLPQTQCRKCGFSGCRPYAEAIAAGRADINQCPPGNQQGIAKLAQLLDIPLKPLNIAHGHPKPPSVVRIDEQLCIGCTLCIQSCPVDAIVGAPKQMHTIIAAECTGCELCIAPCPMDCIDLVVIEPRKLDDLPQSTADRARARYYMRQQRLKYENTTHKKTTAQTGAIDGLLGPVEMAERRKKMIIQTALERAKTIQSQAEKKTSMP